jgi:hypothetical protein
MDGAERARKLTGIASGGVSGRGPSCLCEDGVWGAAVEAINAASSVAVISGFFIPSASAAETDGPSGSCALARAISRIGKDAAIWTDGRCAGVFAACAEAIGFPREKVAVVSGREDFVSMPDLLIFIERLGRAPDGAYYDLRGADVSAFTSPLDEFALRGAARTIGIGDGGNEVGMGNFRERLAEIMPGYVRCLSSVKTDVCVAADVSNWGAYALAAAMSFERGRWIAQSEEEEAAMFEAMKNAGAVDGVTKKNETSADGFALARHVEVVRSLRGLMAD